MVVSFDLWNWKPSSQHAGNNKVGCNAEFVATALHPQDTVVEINQRKRRARDAENVMTTWEGGRGVTKKQSDFLGSCEVKGAGDVRLRERTQMNTVIRRMERRTVTMQLLIILGKNGEKLAEGRPGWCGSC